MVSGERSNGIRISKTQLNSLADIPIMRLCVLWSKADMTFCSANVCF
jgi:hypothetical protein